jgi:RimJ/RimL family protein N-acetyltransferase
MRCDEPRLIHALRLPGGEPVTVRPVCPQDSDALQAYVRALSPDARYKRFFGPLRELPPAELDRVIHLHHRNRLALIAETRLDGASFVIGEARYALGPDRLNCELAVSVAEGWHGKGLGTLLLGDVECRARSLGARHLVGDVLRTNEAMQALARKAGFAMADIPGDAKLVRIVKDLGRPARTALPCEVSAASGLAHAA